MSEEIKKDEAELNGGMDDVVRAVWGAEAVQVDETAQEAGEGAERCRSRAAVNPDTFRDRDESEAKGVDGLVKLLNRTARKQQDEIEERLRRGAKDSLMLGGLCALGVVSLIGAAVSGVWVPVAVGLGVCLSGAAGALVYRGLAVLRG